MTHRKPINNIGMVDLSKFEILENYFTVCVEINIDDILPSMRKKIDNAVAEQIKEYNKEFNGRWGNAEPVIDCVGLILDFRRLGLDYYLSVEFYSSENMAHEDGAIIRFELSEEDLNKLKKFVLKIAIDKFFN